MICSNCKSEDDFYIEELCWYPCEVLKEDKEILYVKSSRGVTDETRVKCTNCNTEYIEEIEIEWP
jgi:hypothetical protein